jgi:hypothetical protein
MAQILWVIFAIFAFFMKRVALCAAKSSILHPKSVKMILFSLFFKKVSHYETIHGKAGIPEVWGKI